MKIKAKSAACAYQPVTVSYCFRSAAFDQSGIGYRQPVKKAAMSRLERGAWRAAGINPLPDYLLSFLWLWRPASACCSGAPPRVLLPELLPLPLPP